MARRRNPLTRWVLTTLSLGFISLSAFLPLSSSRWLGRSMARLAYYLVPRIRQVGYANLDLAYGDALSRPEKKRILLEACDNLGIVAAEFSRIGKVAREENSKFIRVAGLEYLDRSRGALIVGAHLGNWEWMGMAAHSEGFEVEAVVRPLDDPRLDAMIKRIRRSGGVGMISKDDAGPEIVRMLRAGGLVGVLIDQSPRENGVPARFFGQPCWATVAPVMVALRSRTPIHPVAMIRNSDGAYTLEFHPAIEIKRSGNLRRDLVEITQKCQDAIEALVRRHPGQWLWMHRRWKPRPRLEAEWKARQAKDRADDRDAS